MQAKCFRHQQATELHELCLPASCLPPLRNRVHTLGTEYRGSSLGLSARGDLCNYVLRVRRLNGGKLVESNAVANLKSIQEQDTGATCGQILLDRPDPGECRVPSLGNVAALVVDRKAYNLQPMACELITLFVVVSHSSLSLPKRASTFQRRHNVKH